MNCKHCNQPIEMVIEGKWTHPDRDTMWNYDNCGGSHGIGFDGQMILAAPMEDILEVWDTNEL